MCVLCGATQVPVCTTAGPCAGALSQLFTVGLVVGSIVIGTARLWLFDVANKIAPFLNTKIHIKNHAKK